MKKIFTTSILVMIAWGVICAQSTPFRMDRAVLSKTTAQVYLFTTLIEDHLDNNIKILQSKSNSRFPEYNYILENPLDKLEWLEEYIKNDSINNKKFKKSALAQICVSCYRKEYEEQLLLRNQLLSNLAKERYLRDSLEKAEEKAKKVALEEAKKAAQKERESKITGYERLELHLNGIGNLLPHRFTYFRGLDLNFANNRFSRFLQDDVMHLSPTNDSKWEKGKSFVQKYIPRVSTDNEYIIVKYDLMTSHSIPPYYPTDNGSCEVITKVEIKGTADLIIKLFIHYWPSQIKLGGYKQGEIAHYQIMGDYIVLTGTEKYNICKIVITKGNIETDYYKTFKIE